MTINIEKIMQEALVSWSQHATLPPQMRMQRVIADLAPEIADQALRQALPACAACGCVTPGDPDGKECGCDAGCNDGVHPPGVQQLLASEREQFDTVLVKALILPAWGDVEDELVKAFRDTEGSVYEGVREVYGEVLEMLALNLVHARAAMAGDE